MNRKVSLSAFLIISLLSLSSCGNGSSSSTPKITNVENQSISITWDSWDGSAKEISTITRDGTYSGEMIDGIPNGLGSFSSTNSAGITWTYTGGFSDGKFNGYGKTVWEETGEIEEGTYINGVFTPNTYELFNTLSSRLFVPYSFSDKNASFIQDNLDIFPASTAESKEKALTFINADLSYPMMTKTLEGLEGQLYQCPEALATQVFQESLYGHAVTSLVAYDENHNYYVILYDGELPDLYDNTLISFVGLPISYSGYDNVSGGTTTVIVLIGSSVQVES